MNAERGSKIRLIKDLGMAKKGMIGEVTEVSRYYTNNPLYWVRFEEEVSKAYPYHIQCFYGWEFEVIE
jgi:hypothetical protein